MYENGEFKGQLKVQGDEAKQTKFGDEFLIYPPYEKTIVMSLEEQKELFKKELQAIQEYFSDMIILSAVIHRDEVFHLLDEEIIVENPMNGIYIKVKFGPSERKETVLSYI